MSHSSDPAERVGAPAASFLRVLVALAALAFLGAPACNDCDFWAYCDGNVRVVCGAGVDQQVGRTVQRIPCEAPNPVCVAGDRQAVCVRSAEARCPFPSPARCEGTRKITCEGIAGAGDRFNDAGSYDNRGHEVEFDCATVKAASADAGAPPWTCIPATGCVPR